MANSGTEQDLGPGWAFGKVAQALGFGLGAWFLLAGCGKTADTPRDDTGAVEGGGTSHSAGAASAGAAGRAPDVGGASVAGSEGSMPQAGSATEGGTANAAECVEGAACMCGELQGTWHCSTDSAAGACSCPPTATCTASSDKCFEPCGGNAAGLWLLDKSCLPGSADGSCNETSLSGTPSADHQLRFLILENEPITGLGDEAWNFEAQVPTGCLGIEGVKRCSDAEFYVAPLLFGLSVRLTCRPSDCGSCQCSGSAGASAGTGFSYGYGEPWRLGSPTLSFGAVKVPYCADGDTLWAGGAADDGTPKVSYRFHRASCLGTPTPCSQRSDDACGLAGDCVPGHCTSDSAKAACGALGPEQCSTAADCYWEPTGGCSGTSAERCDFVNCDDTPGCHWGEPTERCGGERPGCLSYDAESCARAGCALKTCIFGDSSDGVMPCSTLSASACSKAKGCKLQGSSCTGMTGCWIQTDAQVCDQLGCSSSPDPVCVGTPSPSCYDFSVDSCLAQPGCRIEW